MSKKRYRINYWYAWNPKYDPVEIFESSYDQTGRPAKRYPDEFISMMIDCVPRRCTNGSSKGSRCKAAFTEAEEWHFKWNFYDKDWNKYEQRILKWEGYRNMNVPKEIGNTVYIGAILTDSDKILQFSNKQSAIEWFNRNFEDINNRLDRLVNKSKTDFSVVTGHKHAPFYPNSDLADMWNTHGDIKVCNYTGHPMTVDLSKFDYSSLVPKHNDYAVADLDEAFHRLYGMTLREWGGVKVRNTKADVVKNIWSSIPKVGGGSNVGK